ncbi:MAG: hypothetical protein SGJ11_09380 [Phycisphaerae bacterium]|nr:hypothetical protein [Phycisphaerae bacterium]
MVGWIGDSRPSPSRHAVPNTVTSKFSVGARIWFLQELYLLRAWFLHSGA